ncbi:unnamed protein product [Pleuronectes platessa]|uniref:Uncharacterized protein n=1 Tax=Pleuronectes platessa TaxID=8262 RepID=A0A9N7UMR3_PLEPL|nr:unnamed protein product [Pleuronectes platessa]
MPERSKISILSSGYPPSHRTEPPAIRGHRLSAVLLQQSGGVSRQQMGRALQICGFVSAAEERKPLQIINKTRCGGNCVGNCSCWTSQVNLQPRLVGRRSRLATPQSCSHMITDLIGGSCLPESSSAPGGLGLRLALEAGLGSLPSLSSLSLSLLTQLPRGGGRQSGGVNQLDNHVHPISSERGEDNPAY